MQSNSGSQSHTPGTPYTQAELEAMTVQQIKNLASGLGYSITATSKADIIQEFLAQQ